MIAEKGHFHFADKYWGGGQGPPGPPVPTAFIQQDDPSNLRKNDFFIIV